MYSKKMIYVISIMSLFFGLGIANADGPYVYVLHVQHNQNFPVERYSITTNSCLPTPYKGVTYTNSNFTEDVTASYNTPCTRLSLGINYSLPDDSHNFFSYCPQNESDKINGSIDHPTTITISTNDNHVISCKWE